MPNEWNPHTIFDILGDSRVRTILDLAADRDISVTELTDELDASDSAIYRRVTVLVDAGLLTEHSTVRAGGTHYNVYRTNFDHALVELTDDGLHVTAYDPDGDVTYTEGTARNRREADD